MRDLEEGYFYDIIDEVRDYDKWVCDLYDLGVDVGTHCDTVVSDLVTLLDMYFGTYDPKTGGLICSFMWEHSYGDSPIEIFDNNHNLIDRIDTKEKLWEYLNSRRG